MEKRVTDFARLHREARGMLGFGADAELDPAAQIRVDILVALRTALDSQTAKGGTADPSRLIQVAEALGKLLPAPKENQVVIRLEVGDEGFPEGETKLFVENQELKQRVAELSAETERLQAALDQAAVAEPVRTAEIVEVLPPASTKALPAPEQPQQQPGDAGARPNQQQVMRSWQKQNQPVEPWRSFVEVPSTRRWQPT